MNILSGHEEARYFLNDLKSFLGNKKILFFPSPYKKDHSFEAYDKTSILERTEVLDQLKRPSSNGHILVTYPEALCEKVVTKEKLQQNTYEITAGDELDMDFIIDFLVEYGFERTDFVYEAGTFSIRGGIVDIYSFAHELPVRIELFENKVESIRSFEPSSQLSQKRLHRVTIIPNVEHEEEKISWIPFLDYLTQNTLILYSDLHYIKDVLNKYKEEALEACQSDPGLFSTDPGELFENSRDFTGRLKQFTTIDLGSKPYFNPGYQFTFQMVPQPPFNKNFRLFAQTLKDHTKRSYTNLIFSEVSRQIERIYSIFEDQGVKVDFIPIYKSLHEGFVDNQLKLACFSEHQVFNRFHRYKISTPATGKKALTLKELRKLKPGDYVTHSDHGIGIYRGLQKIRIKDKIQESVRLEYKGGDLLYVNIHSLHKISRYVGKDGRTPGIDKLGSNRWEKLKKRTKKRVKDIARDLIRLYARRKTRKGIKYSPDTYLQTELEASFLYEDTPDQESATRDVKKDMEAEYPMDRLICGDVGFGKTEIAMRAAFKAVVDGKQVAVLVPTTVLAFQHYKTFRERFQDFPVTIEYVSRFRSRRQQKKILEDLEKGKVDILIGTHRLLGKDIKFKNLGLLVVDEEQRFGVAAKEKLKAMKVNVDTLAMTATPIPRTLQFSLMGARDLSIINTPPPNRQPVDTLVEVYNEDTIRNAIEFEVNRGGQVFFVHNRINDIYKYREVLEKLVPYVKIGVGHGQMEGKKLEEVMINFVYGYYDVLLSTSIIESGLDISNANTIIINNAQNFGLSDLYQMRGRVGRSNIKAHAFLLTPPKTVITHEARKRLSAIEEFSDLGSGFNIAMRDLDIRGAGNLLGAEQSGFIAEIGYETYHKILDEAIQELKDTEFRELFREEEKPRFTSRDCQIDTDLEILIPDYYVTNVNERLNLYKELNKIDNEKDLISFNEALKDRFGPLPPQTGELLDTIRLKWMAMGTGIEKLTLKNRKLKATFIGTEENNEFFQSEKFGRILSYANRHPGQCKFEEKKEGLMLVVNKITNIQDALKVLRAITIKEETEAKT